MLKVNLTFKPRFKVKVILNFKVKLRSNALPSFWQQSQFKFVNLVNLIAASLH